MKKCKKILIMGANFSNKGAEAMAYTTISELQDRFPYCEVIMFVHGISLTLEEANYKFKLEEDNKFMREYAAKGRLNKRYIIELIKLRWKYTVQVLQGGKRKKFPVKLLEKYLKDTAFVIDISGYCLSSIWLIQGKEPVGIKNYLWMIEACEKRNIPLYLLPQSFGPFVFSSDMLERVRKLLPTAELIFTREKEGAQQLKESFNLKNLYSSYDLVLQSKISKYDNIIHQKIRKEVVITTKENNIAIVPNMRVFDKTISTELLSLYEYVVKKLIEMGKNIYLLSHSSEDLACIIQIKNRFLDNEQVYLLEDEYRSYEYEELASQFQFMIVSRYHGIVHAYRQNIPCIVIGWAIKYVELLDLFGQSAYMFDAREEIDREQIEQAIIDMNDNYIEEKKKIAIQLNECQKENCFDVLERNIRYQN